MYSEDDLASAVKAGVLSEETAAAFRRHVAQLDSDPSVDDERFRLVTGFNDIFVVIACALSLVSVAWIGAVLAPWVGGLAAAALAWGLAEFFTRKRRMALPSIVLLLAFEGGLFAAGVLYFERTQASFVVASVLALAGAWLHWRRFHVPITMAAGVGAAVGSVVALLLELAPAAANWTAVISFVAGIAIFALAMRWDATDRLRQTRRSDVAFWLHLLAAPLLVRATFAALGVSNGETSLLQALAVVALYVTIALVSLAIDRRALMVAALGYVLYTFSTLLKQYGVVSMSFAITALALGSTLLLLSAFWHTSREVVLKRLPLTLQLRLPPSR